MDKPRYDASGQPFVEETGPKTRAIAVRNWSAPNQMLANVGRVFTVLSEYGLKFLGTGSTHHCSGGRENADTIILFECDDTTYAKIHREPAISGSKELDPHTVMRNLDADVMDATPGEVASIRKEHRANIIQRLLLDCNPWGLNRVTKHLTHAGVAITGVKRPERKVQRGEVVPFKVYVQNISGEARAALANLMEKKNIGGGWGNKSTVRLVGNVVDVQALQDHLDAQFGDRVDRLDLGPVNAVIRAEDQRPTVRL
jgi:hypothetical protein